MIAAADKLPTGWLTVWVKAFICVFSTYAYTLLCEMLSWGLPTHSCNSHAHTESKLTRFLEMCICRHTLAYLRTQASTC